MDNPKSVQIPYDMFRDIARIIYKLEEYALDPETEFLRQKLENQINAKMDAYKRREEYSQQLKNKSKP